jgi:hypothetical protein
VERALELALVAFALLLGLVEGPAEIGCALAIVLGIVRWRAAGKEPGPRAPVGRGLTLAAIGFAVWALAGVPGALGALRPPSSEDALRPLLGLGFVLGVLLVRVELSDRRLANMALAFGGAVVVNGAYGLLQVKLGALPLDRWLLKTPNSAQLFVPDHVMGIRAASGLFYNRLKLAHVGIFALGMMALVALTGRPRPRRTVLALYGAGAAVLAAALVLTYARMALVALVASLVVTVLLLARARWAVLAAALASGAAALTALLPFGRERIAHLLPDLALRRAMFEAGLRIFADHPLLGVGHGVYRTVSAAYLDPSFDGVLRTSPHNLALQVLAETGAIGFLGFAVGVLACLGAAAARVRAGREDGGAEAVLDRVSFFGLLALTLLGLTHFTLHHAPVALLFWCLGGVAAARTPAKLHRDSGASVLSRTESPVGGGR